MDIKTDTFHFTFDLINTYKFALVFFSYSFIFVANRYLLTDLLGQSFWKFYRKRKIY